ncbi:MAG TPA: chorismate mutase, partial [Pyrinomonadaceae bacterium]
PEKVAAGFFVYHDGAVIMDIEYWRKEIDEIDAQLLCLLNMRARLALKVGALKKAKHLPFCDPDREQYVLTRLQDINTGPLDDRAVYKLFRRIIRESRRVQTDVSKAGEFVRSRRIS